jgi:2'-5' RNA ligase
MRAFLAVDLEPAVHAALVELKQALAARVPGVRWVRDEGLHATIKFLGAIAHAQLEAIRTALMPLGRSRAPFDVAAGGLGCFPSSRRPRIVWVGLHGAGLPALADAVEAAVVPLGFSREQRAFRCHVTLGRIDAPQAWARLADALKEYESDSFGSSRVDALHAYESTLQRGGAVYTRLWTIELVESREGGSHGAGCES